MKKSYVLAICMTALFCVVSGCSEPQTTVEEQPKPIMWMKVEKSDFTQVRKISGILRPTESAQLSFQVSGKIKDVYIKLGGIVKKGQVLAQLDKSNYTLTMRAAQGQLKEAQAVFADARITYDRQSILYRKNVIAKSSYDNAKAGIERSKSMVEVAEAQLDLAKKSLKDTSLVAPYDGQITRRLIEPSQAIASGQPCFEISGNQGLELSVLVPETIVNYLDKQHLYKVSFPSYPELKTQARISEIGSKAQTANAFPFILSLNKQSPTLRAGMSAEVDFIFIETKDKGADSRGVKIVRVPPAAIMTGEGESAYVFVFDESARVVKKRKVKPENIINNEVLITSGLEPGEIIATAGVVYLYDGQKVRLMDLGPKVFN